MKERAILLANGEILTMNSATPEPPHRGWVGIVGRNIDLVCYSADEVAEWLANHKDVEEIDCTGCVVMPGLINTHTHIAMTLMRNYADDMELMEWLTGHIWPFEGMLTDDDIAAGARLGAAEMLLGGTTTFVDMYWSEHAVARGVEELGIRALLTESLLDGREELFVHDMDRLRATIEGSTTLSAGVGPHAPYTCSPETLKLAVSYAEQHDLPLTIHLSETRGELDIVREKYGVSPLEYIDQAGALNNRTILAHCVYLSPEEQRRAAEAGASVAHNAQSNMKLASGIAPISEMVANGLNCTIATDGASSNNDLDMWEEMRTATLLQRVLTLDPTSMPAYSALWMATRGGAAALGREDLGAIEAGRLADVIVVDCSAPHMRPRHNLLSAMVYCAKASDVRDVIVDGAIRVRNRQLTNNTPLNKIIDDVEQGVKNILARIKS